MTEQSKLATGMRLGERYELTDQIGEGGFGKIFRARQLNIDRDVAIKILPSRFSDSANVIERFRREARLASRLRHPNTITIHDYGRQDDIFFIVMEYLEGQDLADRLTAKETLPVDKAVDITCQTLESLKEAHNLGIIHRDLKPENIFLTHLGDDKDIVKVLDFGIAKLATQDLDTVDDEGRNLTVQGNTVGTPAYMSPEQAAGEAVNGASDLYTVGVILFEMLNGHPPFSKERPVATMRAHLFDPIPAFSNSSLQNTGLESLVRKALSKEIGDRFGDAAEFLEALSRPDLDSPSLGFVRLNDGPNSEPEHHFDTPVRSHRTPSQDSLSLHNGVDGQTAAEDPVEDPPTDKIPFEHLPEDRDTDSPPAGFSAQQASATSSIITVLDEPQDEDVIVLTDKKETPSSSENPAVDRSANEDHAQPGGSEWGWDSNDMAAADASGSQILTDFDPRARRRKMVFLAVVIAVIAIAAIILLGNI